MMQQNMQNGWVKDMMQYQAKPIVQDKFWIVEKNGEKVGTLRFDDEYILTVNSKDARFKSKDELKNISFADTQVIVSQKKKEHEVHGFPCKNEPYNGIYDLKRKLPIYTKQEKSTSFFCAGYYIINFELGWRPAYCPKLITLTRNEFKGPYKTQLEMKEALRLQS
jgi:hypothetical protein